MNPGTLLIRADASVTMGTGHVMRCLGLAQAWQDAGGAVVLASAAITSALEERLRQENIETTRIAAVAGSQEDAALTEAVVRNRQAAWVVLDGYDFDGNYQRYLKSGGLRVLVIDDDVHAKEYAADLLLNQNAHAAARLYAGRIENARLLLGPQYAVLRRQFAAWRDWQREIPAVGRNVLVTMGGSDPDNFTCRVVEALRTVAATALEANIVVGGSNPHRAGLEKMVQTMGHPVRVISNSEQMPELMAWADVAISGAGTTSWELCLLGVPSLVVDLAKNQLPVAQSLDELEVAHHLGSSRDCSSERISSELNKLLFDAESRRRMSERGRRLVDGRGASRVVAAMLTAHTRLRRATESDCRLLWEWANEPAARASSFSPSRIAWEEHCRWFGAKMADAGCLILIGEDHEGKPVGQVRFNRESDGEAQIDVTIASGRRGGGYGSMMIESAVRQLFASTDIRKVNAFIRPENLASQKAFEKAGFSRGEEKLVRGVAAVHYWREAQVEDDSVVSKGAMKQ